jgi:nucleotide-binding universal stress UspA family protein
MYDRILFPTDGSAPAESALEYAFRIASEHDATLHVLNVADTTRDSLTQIRGEVVDALVQEGREIVDEAAQRATDRDISVVSEVVQGDPQESIIEYSEQFDIDLLVMPTHGRRGLTRFRLGSVTERVINTTTVPVIAVNPDGERSLSYPCQDILVPTDGSPGGSLAVAEGIAVAKATGGNLHLLHVVETGGLGIDVRSALKDEELTARADEILSEAVETARAESLEAVETEIEYGTPSKQVRSYIEANGIDLAVMGTHGTTDFSRYTMGGVSAKIVRTSPVPVMWVRKPASDDTFPT